MLVLSRRIGEAIRIGDDLVLEVLDIGRYIVMLELERPDPDYDRPQWLVVDRRIGESFQVADDIHVFVKDVEGSFVRLGIDAPRQIEIVRAELEPISAEPQESRRDALVDGDQETWAPG